MEQFKLIGILKQGDDMDVYQHQCKGSEEYCSGYDIGYSDEEDFLG
jgi:hypothetical protein